MQLQPINIGSAANDGTGDSPRAAGQKINANFQEVAAAIAQQNNGIEQKFAQQDGAIAQGLAALDQAVETFDATAAAAITDLVDGHAQEIEDLIQQASAIPAHGEQLVAMALTKAVSAVDLFIYDTSKDSDGGAWRKRCQHLSWYNETLNTATRGARRDFPAVALLVLETTKLTIYDADDPTLPMWMVFTGGYAKLLNLGGGMTFNSIAAVNGMVAVGHADTGSAGLTLVELAKDGGRRHGINAVAAAGTARFAGNILQRNDDRSGVIDNTLGFIGNTVVNDVAMAVLPDAPVDLITGLPIPTIAVATSVGVSVLHHDGAVYSGALTNLTGVSITIDQEGTIWLTRGGDRTLRVWPKSRWIAASTFTGWISDAAGWVNVTARLSLGRLRRYACGGQYGLLRAIVGSIPDNVDGRATSLIAHIASSYNSGWMAGSIKGAWLSSKSTSNLVAGGELITNGDFATNDLTGWTDASVGSGTVSAATGSAVLTYVDSSNLGAISQGLVHATGDELTVKFTVTGARSVFVQLGGVNQNSGIFAPGTYIVTFVSTAANQTLVFRATSGTGDLTLDNISVKIGSADRSPKQRGLVVVGTIARAAVAVGAELVGYSGFTAANYLEQPYNADLDFGTGDFSVMAWVKRTGGGNAEIFVERAAYSGGYAGSIINLGLLSSGVARLWVSDDAGATADAATGAANLINSGWHFIVGLRRGASFELWVDGGLAATTPVSAAAASLSNTSAVLRVGGQASGSFVAPNTSVALLRASATAPSADQIRKIYEDERALFQDGAACTLYGASDAVTAVAHDPDTGLLHAGTSAGRSVFQGLRRIANTANAVGAAIAANNNLVADD